MSNSIITFRAIAPISSPLNLHLGVDQFSPRFIKALKSLNRQVNPKSQDEKNTLTWQGTFYHLGGQQNEERQYQSTEENSKDVRLMCWSPQDSDTTMLHVFSNNIAIAEIEVSLDIADFKDSASSNDALVKLIEDKVQQLAKSKILSLYESYCQDIQQLHQFLNNDFIISEVNIAPEISWTARTMVFSDEQISQELTASILTSWLKKTGRPEDAVDILSGVKNYSLTWLNYAVKNPKPVGEDPYIQIMVLSQYYYVSQEHSNSALRNAIEIAYSPLKKQQINKVLSRTRTACRLNQIAFYENIKFLSRPNRALLEDIIHGWKFEQLVENSERMIEICDARLQEEDNKKRERSTVMTDFLLVTLSFFAVFELSLYLTEFSREMMSRPALDYNDSKSSFFLGLIAEIDADIMFSLGFGLTLVLILFYRYIKRN